jgi:hypothetical protein
MSTSLPNRAASPSLVQLSQQLGMLIKITRTIDRRSEDKAHGRNGENIYVFDTNVVQMFLEPFKNPHFAETFYSPVWHPPHRHDMDRAADEINAQSCLIAAEYLMSGQLPGQNSSQWFMTSGHSEELQRQIGHLVERSRETAARLSKDDHFAKFALDRILELEAVVALDPDKDRDVFLKIADGLELKTPLVERIGDLDATAFKDRAEGLRIHEICRLLAMDSIAEPAKQLMRLRTPGIFGKRRTFEQHLQLSASDWGAIRVESANWRETLAVILRRQPGKAKTRSALTADCDALALVAWANLHRAKPHQRMLFVTGDRALLEACRQRYVDDPRQQFFVRSIAQFAPLFNSASARGQLKRDEAFGRLREVLERSMVALNLGLLAIRNSDQRARARDGFALLVETAPESVSSILRSFFPKTVDPNWLMEQDSALNKLVEELRSIELLLLEADPDLVARRLDKEHRRVLKTAAQNGGKALANAISGLLDNALSDGARFSTYMMPTAVEELLRQIEGSSHISQRVSIQIRLPLLATKEFSDFRATVGWLKRQTPEELESTLGRLSERPETIFALAAMLAFSLEIWKEAARYADLAARALDEYASAESHKSRDDRVDRYELYFLRAISLRFRLSAEYGEPLLDGNGGWRGWHQQALSVLDDCFGHHNERDEWARALRAVSERVALRLAVCEINLFVPPDTALTKDREEETVAHLTSAIDDLTICDTLAVRTVARVNDLSKAAGGEASAAVFEAAERQYLYNTCAARTIMKVLLQARPERTEMLEPLLGKLPARPTPPWAAPPPIAMAYKLAADENWNELAKIDENSVSLTLDAVAIRSLKRLGLH